MGKRVHSNNTALHAEGSSQINITRINSEIHNNSGPSTNKTVFTTEKAVVTAQQLDSKIIQGEKVVSEGLEKDSWWRNTLSYVVGKETLKPYKQEGKCGALIICNCFDNPDEDDKRYEKNSRPGAREDIKNIQRLLKEDLKCDIVKIARNITAKKLQPIIKEFQRALTEPEGIYGSSIVVIMSHGGKNANSILMEDLEEKNIYTDFVYQFSHNRFPGFKEKPKIFIVQACQDCGDEELPTQEQVKAKAELQEKELPAEEQVVPKEKLPAEEQLVPKEELPGGDDQPESKRSKPNHSEDQDDAPETKPTEPLSDDDEIHDVLVCHATIPYRVALRHEEKGSIFIQSIVEVFGNNAASCSLRKMLQLVHDDVREKTKNTYVIEETQTGEEKKVYIKQSTSVWDAGFQDFEFK